MSKTLSNGFSIQLAVNEGQRLRTAWRGGSYSATIVAGGAGQIALATNAITDNVFGPYTGGRVIRLTCSAIGSVDYEVGYAAAIRSESDGLEIIGAPGLGNVLSAVFTGQSTGAVQWYRDVGAGPVAISGATSLTYTQQAADIAPAGTAPYILSARSTSITLVSNGLAAPYVPALTGGLPSYLGQVGIRSYVYSAKPGSTFKQIRGQRGEMNVVACSQLTLVFNNWYVVGAGNTTPTYLETGSGGTARQRASIEYPPGVFTRVTFGGANFIDLADAGSVTTTVDVVIPALTPYKIHYMQEQLDTGFIVYVNGGTASPGESFNTTLWGDMTDIAASGLADLTMTGGYTNSNPGFHAGPTIVAAQTTKPSNMYLGNSIDYGQNGTVDASGVTGIGAPSFVKNGVLGLMNGGIKGDQWSKVVTSNAKRLALAQYFSHVTLGGATNDLAGGRTSVQILGDYQTTLSLFPTKKRFVFTTLPYGSGASGTTVAAGNASRVIVNNAIKAGVAQALGFFDPASILESPTVSGTWQYAGDYDTAGTHPSQQGYDRVTNSGVINNVVFTQA